ncbi:MAG TPA: hypothetical protein VHC69_33885 [Polyangiaceae bacterium]|nr:hypothetical protein [Polyangiaceae bacterium]HVW30413.1 hypothetical protein [Polyangiaceae bacterium]
MRRKLAILGVALLTCGSVALSCSDDNDDPVGRACQVVVGQCHVMSNMGDCIDAVGDIDDSDCVLCIATSSGCDYDINCPRTVMPDGCDFPSEIIPKQRRTSSDAGTPAVSGGSATDASTP